MNIQNDEIFSYDDETLLVLYNLSEEILKDLI